MDQCSWILAVTLVFAAMPGASGLRCWECRDNDNCRTKDCFDTLANCFTIKGRTEQYREAEYRTCGSRVPYICDQGYTLGGVTGPLNCCSTDLCNAQGNNHGNAIQVLPTLILMAAITATILVMNICIFDPHW